MQNQPQEREEVTRSSDSDLAEMLRQSRSAKDEEGESHFFFLQTKKKSNDAFRLHRESTFFKIQFDYIVPLTD